MCFVPALILVSIPMVADYFVAEEPRSWKSRSLHRFGRVAWANEKHSSNPRDNTFLQPRVKPRREEGERRRYPMDDSESRPTLNHIYKEEFFDDWEKGPTKATEPIVVEFIDKVEEELELTIFPQPSLEVAKKNAQPQHCQMEIAETLPDGLYNLSRPLDHLTIHEAWLKLFNMAESKIEIVSYHWGLRRGSGKGEEVYDALAAAISQRHLEVKIIHTSNHTDEEAYDTSDLKRLNPSIVEVRSIDVAGLLNSVGVLHSKLLIADRKHFYLGSANLSDRGLTRTKEMGVLVTMCQRLAEDAAKLFEVYWELARTNRVPKTWPESFSSEIHVVSPQMVENDVDGHMMRAYLGSSPKPFCPAGRTDDLTAIIETIDAADKFVYIAVADYVPMRIFGEREYWPLIDDRLRMAAINRNVTVRLLVSDRANSRPYMKRLLRSLLTLNGLKQVVSLEIKLFAADIPHFRSSHNKYMVTDKTGYIGTSNWTKDYFLQTAGLAFIFESMGRTERSTNKKDMREKLAAVFLRDWNSQWAKPLAMT